MNAARLVVVVAMVLSGAAGALAADGKLLFQQFCAGCHYQGGNSVNPAKPLTKLYREANGLRTTHDLVTKMRRGGQGMPAFPANRLPEPAARAIADYIQATF